MGLKSEYICCFFGPSRRVGRHSDINSYVPERSKRLIPSPKYYPAHLEQIPLILRLYHLHAVGLLCSRISTFELHCIDRYGESTGTKILTSGPMFSFSKSFFYSCKSRRSGVGYEVVKEMDQTFYAAPCSESPVRNTMFRRFNT